MKDVRCRLVFKKGKQKELIIYSQNYLKLNQREFSEFINVNRRTLRNWLTERNLLPKNIFIILKERIPLIKRYQKYIIDELQSNWGSVKGGKRTFYKITGGDKSKIYDIMSVVRSKRIFKRTVHNKTPSCAYTRFIVKNKIEPLPLLISLLMTDGNVYKNQITYGTIDKTLRNIFIDLCKMCGVTNVSEYKIGSFMKLYTSDRGLLENLSAYSSSYKKSPNARQTKKEFLKEMQPSIKKLTYFDDRTVIECIRLALSSDGNISVMLKKRDNKLIIKPQLALNCSNVNLCREWMDFFNRFDIKMNIYRDRNVWSGIKGIVTDSRKNMKKFYDLGGFIDGVKISRKSKRLFGIEKNKVLRFILLKNEVKDKESLLAGLKKMGS